MKTDENEITGQQLLKAFAFMKAVADIVGHGLGQGRFKTVLLRKNGVVKLNFQEDWEKQLQAIIVRIVGSDEVMVHLWLAYMGYEYYHQFLLENRETLSQAKFKITSLFSSGSFKPEKEQDTEILLEFFILFATQEVNINELIEALHSLQS